MHSPRSEVRLPFGWVRSIGCHYSNIIVRNIGGKKHVKCFGRKNQVTRKVLIVRIMFDDLVRVDSIDDFTSRDVTPLQSHVHVIRPEDSPLAHATLNERERI